MNGHPCQAQHLPSAACRNPPPAWCVRCGEETPTVYRQLRGGQFHNLCRYCRSARIGKPFISPAIAAQFLQAIRQEDQHETFYA